MSTTIKLGLYRDEDQTPWMCVQSLLAPLGIDLIINLYCSYDILNMSLAAREIDLNSFQSREFLAQENALHGYNLVALANTYIEPMCLYSNKRHKNEDLKAGDLIVLPEDKANLGRALYILNDYGIITIDPNAGYRADLDDILSNPHNLRFTKVDSEHTIDALDDKDVAATFVFANIADAAGLQVHRDGFCFEKFSYLNQPNYPFMKVIAVRQGEEKRIEFAQLVNAFRSSETVALLHDIQHGQIILGFEDPTKS